MQGKRRSRAARWQHVSSKRAVQMAFMRKNVEAQAVKVNAAENIYLVLFVAVHRAHGFGKARLMRLFGRMHEIEAGLTAGDYSVADINEALEAETGMGFARADVRREMQQKTRDMQLSYSVVDELSSAYLAAMRDVFGFGGRRLAALYHVAADIAGDITTKKVTYNDLRAELAKVGLRLVPRRERPQEIAAVVS